MCTQMQVRLRDGRVVYACEHARTIAVTLGAPDATRLKRDEVGEWYVASTDSIRTFSAEGIEAILEAERVLGIRDG